MLRSLTIVLLAASPAVAADALSGPATNVYLSYGESQPNRHGQAFLRSVTFERAGFEPHTVARRLAKVRAGFSLTYSDVRQPRSWFGHTYGDPDDHVRAEWASFFLRREWRDGAAARPFVDLGTGPMWSNRRIPAATSRFNFYSQLNLGLALGEVGRRPLYLAYRFSHISNFEFAKRNPGWDIHTLLIGTRLSRQ